MDPIEFAAGLSMVIGSVGGVAILVMLARGLLKKWVQPPAATADADQVRELRHAVSQIAAEVAELHERIDFTERVLAAQQDLPKLEERH
jgi:hypothetical protein